MEPSTPSPISTPAESAVNKEIDRAVQVIKEADAIVFTSGAGLGVDSGLPDFRGPEGFWRAYPPMKHLGLRFEQMSDPVWFEKDPLLAWGFWAHRYNLYKTTTPHAGFLLMRELGEEKVKKGKGFFVVTSNVDGQFLKAGFPYSKLLEVHGSSQHMQCVDPTCESGIWPAGDLHVDFDGTTFRAKEPLPKCKTCGKLVRPNVLMFDDTEWRDERFTDQEINYDKWILSLAETDKVAIVEIGAGTAVPTIRAIGKRLADNTKFHGTLIRINPGEPTVHGDRNISIPLGGLAALQRIHETLFRPPPAR